uniref:Uncharacterized protein n=1 Tax=Rhizophora mucronata TaxID=61149 RepID=A0A2P2P1W1_RHIMU
MLQTQWLKSTRRYQVMITTPHMTYEDSSHYIAASN